MAGRSRLPIKINKRQMEILNGALLGDGSLWKRKNIGNAQFIYLSSSKEHVEYISKYFSDLIYSEGVKETSYHDKRTDKVYIRYAIRTCQNVTFTKIRDQWYSDKKHIPKDLKLTPLTCLIWYIGDGSLWSDNHTQFIKLSTHCFELEEIRGILLPQLSMFEAKEMKTDNEQYFIYIPRRKIKDFLNYIGSCPVTDYSYKWDYKEYKNKQPDDHKQLEKEFVKLFKEGNTYYKIAKKYGVEPNAVKYYLIKNNLYTIGEEREKPRGKNAELEDQFLNLYQQGLSCYKIAQKFGIGPSSVKHYLVKRGFYKPRKRGKPLKKK